MKCQTCSRNVKKVFKYRVDITYDMGMSDGGETMNFTACNDEEARGFLKEIEGESVVPNKRDVHVKMETFSRVIEGNS